MKPVGLAEVLKELVRLCLDRAEAMAKAKANEVPIDEVVESMKGWGERIVNAILSLDIGAATELNAALCQHTFFKMGLRDDVPPDLSKIDLVDMVAAAVFQREIDDRDKSGTFHTVMDDRAVAAIYTAYHYDGSPQREPEPVAFVSTGRTVGPPLKAVVIVQAGLEDL